MGFCNFYYNIPSNNRELQRGFVACLQVSYYNIPSNNRELQRVPGVKANKAHYNIPSNNRELQLQCIMGIQ